MPYDMLEKQDKTISLPTRTPNNVRHFVYHWQGVTNDGQMHKGRLYTSSVTKLREHLIAEGICLVKVSRRKVLSKQCPPTTMDISSGAAWITIESGYAPGYINKTPNAFKLS